MKNKQEPNFHPITMLPMINSIITEMFENTEEQYQTLLIVKDKPYSMNNQIVSRIFKLYKEQLENLEPFEAQLKLWRKLPLSQEQEEIINADDKEITQIRKMSLEILEILEIAEDIKDFTIERLLEKDDAEIGLEWLLKNAKQ